MGEPLSTSRRRKMLYTVCLGVVLGAVVLFVLLYIFVWRKNDGTKFTSVLCRTGDCPDSALPLLRDGRALGNKVDDQFVGYSDVWASGGANVFTCDLYVRAGQAWPRIFQGITYPLNKNGVSERTKGYPVSVSMLTSESSPNRYISYNGTWQRRENGPNTQNSTTFSGPLFNGAYIWLSDPLNSTQWKPHPIPKWPYEIEVNVWNRYGGTGYREGAERFKDYYDLAGKYEVRGHYATHDNSSFYAYYVTLEKEKQQSNMVINLKSLLAHLRDYTKRDNGTAPAVLTGRHEVVEVAVAAEGHEGADGKFYADISTMGRVET